MTQQPFVSSAFCKFDVLRVRLKYPHSPSADPLHFGVFISSLRQTGNLGGWSSHACVHHPRLNATRLGPSMVGYCSAHFRLCGIFLSLELFSGFLYSNSVSFF